MEMGAYTVVSNNGTNHKPGYKKSSKQKQSEKQRKKAGKSLRKGKLKGFARGSQTKSKAEAVEVSNAMIMNQIAAAAAIGQKESKNTQDVMKGLRGMMKEKKAKRPTGTVGKSAIAAN